MLCLPVAAFQVDSSGWVVDEDRAPFTTLEFVAEEGTWMSVDVSPDGRKLAFDLLGHLYEMKLDGSDGGEARALTSGRSWNTFPRYSADGKRLLFTSDRGGSEDLWTLELESGALANVSHDDLPVFQGTWSRDGRHVYGTALDMRVRFPVFQFNFHGTKQELLPAGGRNAAVHFEHHPIEDALYFEHQDGNYPGSGPRIKRYDLRTGRIEVVVERPGGGANPSLSPDGRWLAYVHRDDKENVVVLHDLATREERVLVRGLDRARMEDGYFYGLYPNMSWTPDGAELVLSLGGGLYAVNVASGELRKLPFRAPVSRHMDETRRFPGRVASGTALTRSHRWGRRVDSGVLFETLGDLWIRGESGTRRLTDTPAHETNPIFDPRTQNIWCATWTDDERGGVALLADGDAAPVRLGPTPATQYGSLALAPDGRRLAYLRGAGGLVDGEHLEDQTEFQLAWLDVATGVETEVTEVAWSGNRYAKRPPTVAFGPAQADGEARLYFTEFVDDALVLKRIRPDGLDEEDLVRFPHATRAVLSPDFQWIAFREYHRTYVTPFEFAGSVQDVSAEDGKGFTRRVDARWDGDFTEWSADGRGLEWTRGTAFFEKSLAAVLAGEGEPRRTELAVEYEIAAPRGTTALTGVTALTMNSADEVLENVTILIEDDRIAAVGPDLEVPQGARVFDLTGHVVMPGMFDAHGHYGSPISALNVIEQRHYGLQANLAYGVTTMFDVYGTTQKDFWIADMLQAGRMDGPRLYSVGDPIFVTKYRTKMHRSIDSYADALEHARFNQEHGAPALKDYSNHTRAARQQLTYACNELGLNLVTESFANPAMNFTQLIDGFTGIEHTPGLTPLYDDVQRLFGATQVGMTPTLIVVYNGPAGEVYFHQTERLWEDEKLLRFFRKDELLSHRRPTFYWEDDLYHPEMAAQLHELYEQGVLLQMGAHGQMMGLGAHWELELFVQGGFTPLEALRVATINGFRHHGLDHELGSIEPGKFADLVVLTEDPREDIRHTRSIRYVLKNGVVYDGDDLARIHPDPRPAAPLYFKER